MSAAIDINSARPLTIEQMARALGGGQEKPNGRGGWTTLCPVHEADGSRHDTSLDIDLKDGKQLLKCRAGCTQSAIIDALKHRQLWPDRGDRRRETRTLRSSGLTLGGFAQAKRLPLDFLREHGVRDGQGEFGPVVEFHYRLEDGEPAPRYRVRYALTGKKRFCFNSNIGEVVAYGLDRLHLARKGALLIAEGESDYLVCRYHNINALGIPGASMTKTLPVEQMLGISPIVISQEPGRDGQNFRNNILTRLRSAGWHGEVRVIEWPGDGLKDLADLHVICADTPGAFESKLSVLIADAEVINLSGKTRILIDGKSENLPAVTRLCWQALKSINEPPYLFRHAGELKRVEPSDENDGVSLRAIDEKIMRYELARAADWMGKNFTAGKPHIDHVRDVLAIPNPSLPILRRITSVPIFLADGTLIKTPGFTQGVLYCPPPGFVLPAVPTRPSEDDVRGAVKWIDDLVCDFPFVDRSDRAHAIALLLLLFFREIIEGPTPMHRAEAPTPGSGKSLLIEILLHPATAGAYADLTNPSDDEALKKEITAALREGHPAINFDNVKTVMDFASLESALTKPIWYARLLGRNDVTLAIPITCAWAMSANNPVLDREMLRRSPRIRLDAKMENPERRDGFRHPNIRSWAAEHRQDLVWAALVLIQNWIAHDRPRSTIKPLGSFEEWTGVMGGVLECARVEGFLASIADDSGAVDTEGAALGEIIIKWAAMFQSAEVSAADLFPLAKEIDGINLGWSGNERSERTAFGMVLGKLRDRIVNGYRIEYLGSAQRAARWRLQKWETDK